MAEPFLAEIKLFPFPFAPRGWALCNGQMLPINQNQALFALVGATYGGNGQTTFALPDLRGKAPVHFGSLIALGSTGGEEIHTLTAHEMPMHTHQVYANVNTGNNFSPENNTWAAISNENTPAYASEVNGEMNPESVSVVGQSQPHNNMQPYMVLNYCIAIQGIFPSRN